MILKAHCSPKRLSFHTLHVVFILLKRPFSSPERVSNRRVARTLLSGSSGFAGEWQQTHNHPLKVVLLVWQSKPQNGFNSGFFCRESLRICQKEILLGRIDPWFWHTFGRWDATIVFKWGTFGWDATSFGTLWHPSLDAMGRVNNLVSKNLLPLVWT